LENELLLTSRIADISQCFNTLSLDHLHSKRGVKKIKEAITYYFRKNMSEHKNRFHPQDEWEQLERKCLEDWEVINCL
jgi:hypothetical protein